MTKAELLSALGTLIQLGGIGGSLAFLFLGYQLLQKERSLTNSDGNPEKPRPQILKAIRHFVNMALVFFLAGVIGEIVLSNASLVIASSVSQWLRDDLVRARMNAWDYRPDKGTLSVSFEENRFDSTKYIVPALKDTFSVVIGVRPKTGLPAEQGEYPIVLGPYRLENTTLQTRQLIGGELAALGNGCVEFVAFGVSSGQVSKGVAVPAPFKPSTVSGTVVLFNEANTCKN